MTIFFLTPVPSSTLGGVQKHVRLLSEELQKRGHTVTEMSLASEVGRIPRKLDAWKRLWRERDRIRNADVIHIHDVFWWYAPFRFLFPRKQIYTTFHGWEGIYPPAKSEVFQKRLAKRLSRGVVGVGNFFPKWYGVTPTVVTFGVLDRPMFFRAKQAELPLKLKTIAFFGRLERVNGIEVALPALDTLRGQGHRILFIGDGSFRKRAEEVGVVTGTVSTPWQFVLESDLVVTSSYLCMLESAALLRPIISIANNPLKSDYLRTHPLNRCITMTNSSDSLSEAIKTFSHERAQNEIRYAQGWALAQTPEKLADLYENLWK